MAPQVPKSKQQQADQQKLSASASASGSGKQKKQPLRLKVDGYWYDLTNWAEYHPGGEEIMRHLHNQDATDVFASIHSKEAYARLERMSRKACTPDDDVPPTQVEASFRKLKAELEQEGYYDRNLLVEALLVGVILALTVVGVAVAPTNPWLAVFLLGLGQQQAGWAGHSFIHMRGESCGLIGLLLSTINGFSPRWWSNKHNTHHSYTNHTDRDLDIQLSPVLYLIDPEPHDDSRFRKYQHLYFFPVLSLLYASWRQQSLFYAVQHRLWSELAVLAVNYAWMSLLPWQVSLGAVLWGGFLVGLIVTPTHQSEHFIKPENRGRYSFAAEQFLTTRNAHTSNMLLHWLWGSMDTQLEHHLFPTMPPYYYKGLRTRVMAWAQANGLKYLEDDSFYILYRNWCTMRRVAHAAAAKTVHAS